MKVLYVITEGTWGGAQSHLYAVIGEQVKRGNNVILCTGKSGRLTSLISDQFPSVNIIIIDSLCRDVNVKNDLSAIINLRSVLKEHRPDLIHLHSTKAGMIGRIAALGFKTPVLYTVHGWAFTPGVSRKRVLITKTVEKLLSPLTTTYVCVSKYDYLLGVRVGIIRKGHPGIIIHNGVELEKVQEQKKSNGPLVVTMAARFADPKRQDLLVNALTAFPKGAVVLRFLGDGPLIEKVKRQVLNLHLNECVEFYGSVKDVQKFYAQSDVVALISDHEGLPISLIEGLAQGKPLLASDVGGVDELFAGNGKIVDNKPRNIVAGLTELMKDSNLREKMGDTSFHLFYEEYTQKEMLRKINGLYDQFAQ